MTNERQYTKRDVENLARRARLHLDLNNATQALLRAQCEVQHEDAIGDFPTVVGRFERIQKLLGELKELMLKGVTP